MRMKRIYWDTLKPFNTANPAHHQMKIHQTLSEEEGTAAYFMYFKSCAGSRAVFLYKNLTMVLPMVIRTPEHMDNFCKGFKPTWLQSQLLNL